MPTQSNGMVGVVGLAVVHDKPLKAFHGSWGKSDMATVIRQCGFECWGIGTGLKPGVHVSFVGDNNVWKDMCRTSRHGLIVVCPRIYPWEDPPDALSWTPAELVGEWWLPSSTNILPVRLQPVTAWNLVLILPCMRDWWDLVLSRYLQTPFIPYIWKRVSRYPQISLMSWVGITIGHNDVVDNSNEIGHLFNLPSRTSCIEVMLKSGRKEQVSCCSIIVINIVSACLCTRGAENREESAKDHSFIIGFSRRPMENHNNEQRIGCLDLTWSYATITQKQ